MLSTITPLNKERKEENSSIVLSGEGEKEKRRERKKTGGNTGGGGWKNETAFLQGDFIHAPSKNTEGKGRGFFRGKFKKGGGGRERKLLPEAH